MCVIARDGKVVIGNQAKRIADLEMDLAATEERVREHEVHENQTHAVLGKILGADDTLENVARRAVARIVELETQIDLLQNEIFELRKGTDSQKVISELMARVAALREIAVNQLAEKIYDSEYNMESIGKYFWQRDEKIQKKFLDDARRQLSEEHPEAFR